MPSLQFSAATIAGLLNGSQNDNAAKGAESAGKPYGGKDQFSSLLDVVGNISDTPNAGNNLKDNGKKDDDKTPVAAAIDVPAPFKTNTRAGDDKKDNKVDNDAKVDNSAKPAAKAKDDTDNSQQKPAVAGNDDNAPVQKTADNKILKAGKAANTEKTSVEDSSESDSVDELKAKISERVDNLAGIMNIIAQLLAGAQAVPAANDITVSVNAAGDNIAASAATKAVSDPFAIFADLKDTLAKLQQFLQAANGQDAPLSDEQAAALNDINTALASDLDALKNLLPQDVNGDKKQSLLDILQAQQPVENNNTQSTTLETGDVKSLLANDIALIRGALQKFKALSEASPAKQPATQPAAADMLLKQIMPQDNSRANDNQPVNPIVLPIAIQADTAASQQTQTQNNPVVFSAAASVHIQNSGAETETGSGGNMGQGSSNSQPQITTGGISATQTGATDKAAGSQFSAMLHRATQTPVTEQVAFQIKTAVNTGNSKISIQLHPEDLGKLDITLDVDAKGKTGVTVTADNKQTLDLLQRDSQGLQKALADAGLKTDAGSLSFNLRGGEREGQGSQNQSQAASQYQKSQPDDAQGEINIAQVAAVTRSYTLTLPDGLDIKI